MNSSQQKLLWKGNIWKSLVSHTIQQLGVPLEALSEMMFSVMHSSAKRQRMINKRIWRDRSGTAPGLDRHGLRPAHHLRVGAAQRQRQLLLERQLSTGLRFQHSRRRRRPQVHHLRRQPAGPRYLRDSRSRGQLIYHFPFSFHRS